MAGFNVGFDFMAANGGVLFGCLLHPEHIDIQQMREPSIIALPQQNANGRGTPSTGSGVPKNVAMDFGIMQENIVITGKLPDEDLSDVNNNITAFMSFFRNQWVESPTVIVNNNSTGMIRVRFQLGANDSTPNSWRCMPIKSTFSRSGGNTWWDYSITLGVVIFPEVLGGN